MEKGLSYEIWIDQNRNYLNQLPGKTVFVLFSGGKDSSIVLHFMQIAAKELNFSFEIHAAIYPKHVLTKEEMSRLDSYWNLRGLMINWHQVPESDEMLSGALEKGVSPCLICNTSKKTALGAYIKKNDIPVENLTIIISYSLWDLVSATIEHVLGNAYCSNMEERTLAGKSPEERFLEIAQRFYPYLNLNGGMTVFKPLIGYNDQEINHLIQSEGIPLTGTVCQFKKFRPKRLFADYYQSQGLKFDFQNVKNFAEKHLGLPKEHHFSQVSGKDYLKSML